MGITVIGSAVGIRLDVQESISFVERGLVRPTVQMTDLDKLSAVSEQITQGKVRPEPLPLWLELTKIQAIGKFVVRFREDELPS
jgi:propanol-preferring alcohol dehydrogenase